MRKFAPVKVSHYTIIKLGEVMAALFRTSTNQMGEATIINKQLVFQTGSIIYIVAGNYKVHAWGEDGDLKLYVSDKLTDRLKKRSQKLRVILQSSLFHSKVIIIVNG